MRGREASPRSSPRPSRAGCGIVQLRDKDERDRRRDRRRSSRRRCRRGASTRRGRCCSSTTGSTSLLAALAARRTRGRRACRPVRCPRSLVRASSTLGPDALIGLTANTPAHLEAVRALPAGTVDYLGVGVIRPTSTKPDHPAPLGIDGFARRRRASPLPCVAIGGVGVDDVAALRRRAPRASRSSRRSARPRIRAGRARALRAWGQPAASPACSASPAAIPRAAPASRPTSSPSPRTAATAWPRHRARRRRTPGACAGPRATRRVPARAARRGLRRRRDRRGEDRHAGRRRRDRRGRRLAATHVARRSSCWIR